MALTDLKIQSLKPTVRPQKVADGDGMYLYITPSGTKSWRIDYTYGGKRLTYTLGKYPHLTLAMARNNRSEFKRLLQNGINPAVEKKKTKAGVVGAAVQTFRIVAQEWYDGKAPMRSKAWKDANLLYLERDLYPLLGSIPIREINGKLLLDVLEQCANRSGLKTADRVRQTSLQVFEYATLKFKIDENPAIRLKRWAEIPRPVNRPHLAEHEVQDLISAIDEYRGYLGTKLAAKLLLLTFVRKSELLEATWDEIDLQSAKWLIPAARMKMKSPHMVPLSTEAVRTLKAIRDTSNGANYLFPSSSTLLKPLSRTALNNMFSKMQGKKYKGKFSPHGIRATASTWLNEHGFRHDVIERQLAHTERNQVRASYNHADYLVERRQMMQAWSDFLFPSTEVQSRESFAN